MKKEELIAAEDTGNDIAMIEYADLGVAMENAFHYVKKSANYVTKTNEENGVSHIIQKFMLNQK